jgi:hypothetical protein
MALISLQQHLYLQLINIKASVVCNITENKSEKFNLYTPLRILSP